MGFSPPLALRVGRHVNSPCPFRAKQHLDPSECFQDARLTHKDQSGPGWLGLEIYCLKKVQISLLSTKVGGKIGGKSKACGKSSYYLKRTESAQRKTEIKRWRDIIQNLIRSLELRESSCVCEWVAQSCLTLCDPMDCSLPGSSVHVILQVRILEWAVIPFSRGSSQIRDRTQSPALQANSLLSEPPGKPLKAIPWIFQVQDLYVEFFLVLSQFNLSFHHCK